MNENGIEKMNFTLEIFKHHKRFVIKFPSILFTRNSNTHFESLINYENTTQIEFLEGFDKVLVCS